MPRNYITNSNFRYLKTNKTLKNSMALNGLNIKKNYFLLEQKFGFGAKRSKR